MQLGSLFLTQLHRIPAKQIIRLHKSAVAGIEKVQYIEKYTEAARYTRCEIHGTLTKILKCALYKS